MRIRHSSRPGLQAVVVMAFALSERAHGLIHVNDNAVAICLDPDLLWVHAA